MSHQESREEKNRAFRLVSALVGQHETCLPLAATAYEALGTARARPRRPDTCATLLWYEDSK